MEQHLSLNDEQWAKIEPLLSSPDSSPERGEGKHAYFTCR